MRVLITDDSAFMRKALAALLSSDKSIEIVDTAHNGEDALKKIAQHKPDVVTLDIEMPVMDGLTCLSKIRLLPEPRPAVLVCSTLTVAGSQHALKAAKSPTRSARATSRPEPTSSHASRQSPPVPAPPASSPPSRKPSQSRASGTAQASPLIAS
jgi:chemotaxis response regulator CheB